MEINLKKYGLTEDIENMALAYPHLILARVTEQHRSLYRIVTKKGFSQAKIAGKLQYQITNVMAYPAVGDWVMIDENSDVAIIQQVLTRKSVLTREVSGNNDGQIIASNIDVVFICMSLNNNFNVHRIERYLTISWESGALPVVVLTKSDLCDDLPEKLHQLEDVCLGVDIIICSAKNQEGYSDLLKFTTQNRTVAFVGSSGVGKSTLINWLAGEDKLVTNDIRTFDDKGRHTTTFRQLLLLPQGGVVIDTPGMRELQVQVGDLSKTFSDIEQLAVRCKFRNCSHQTEPGCAVRQAIAEGTLSLDRLESYFKMQLEMSYDGMNSRQLENDKINRMFGSKQQMKQVRKHIKHIRK